MTADLLATLARIEAKLDALLQPSAPPPPTVVRRDSERRAEALRRKVRP